MNPGFVQIGERIININHIVQVYVRPDEGLIKLITGELVDLTAEQAAKLARYLPQVGSYAILDTFETLAGE